MFLFDCIKKGPLEIVSLSSNVIFYRKWTRWLGSVLFWTAMKRSQEDEISKYGDASGLVNVCVDFLMFQGEALHP